MVTQVRVLPKQRQRPAVMVKTNRFLQKKSTFTSRLIAFSNLLTGPRLSREEREAAYNKARERIFGKEENAGDVTPGKLLSEDL